MQASGALVLLVVCMAQLFPVLGQICDCRTSATFHLESILAREENGLWNTESSSTAFSSIEREDGGSSSPMARVNYRYCELPRTERAERTCQPNDDRGSLVSGFLMRQHFHAAPVCSEWKTKPLPPPGSYIPIFWGATLPTNSVADPNDNDIQPCRNTMDNTPIELDNSAVSGCSRPGRTGPRIVFASTEEEKDRICFSYRQQVLNEEYCAVASKKSEHRVDCEQYTGAPPAVHRLVLERTNSTATVDTLYVEYTFHTGPAVLQDVFPSSLTCPTLDVKQACVGTERSHLSGLYQRIDPTSYRCRHPNAIGDVYLHAGIEENTVLYYNEELEGWSFVPEDLYCEYEEQFISAIFRPGSDTVTCVLPGDIGTRVQSPLDISCVPAAPPNLNGVCSGMDGDGGMIFRQECVSPTVFRQQYSLCKNGEVVAVENRVSSCYGRAGVERETYCHDRCGGGALVCSTTADPTAACQLVNQQDCHGGVWGWAAGIGCFDDDSFVSFEKQCEDGVLIGGMRVSDPVSCRANNRRFTRCHDGCQNFSICSSDSFQCPAETDPPTWMPTPSPTAIPTSRPTNSPSRHPPFVPTEHPTQSPTATTPEPTQESTIPPSVPFASRSTAFRQHSVTGLLILLSLLLTREPLDCM